MSKLGVISSCRVPMASNEITLSRLELTPWDLQLLLLEPIQKGILFHKSHESDQKNIIDHLKHSLSRTLAFFPPLAGRLGRVNNDDNTACFFVDCNNEGAEFIHAVSTTLSVLDISEAKYTPEIISSFFPLNGVRNFEGVFKPLFGVQITELVDGFFIGCTANHAVVDGTSFWHFINSWSEISRGFGKISKSPVFERNLPDDYNRLFPISTFDENFVPKLVRPPLLERVFNFSQDSVANLKAKANSEAGCYVISSLQALLAHLWRSVERCRSKQISSHINNDVIGSQEIFLVLPVGVRARIPLPDGYFGNAIYVPRFGICETELLQNGLGHVGQKINAFVTQQTSEAAIFKFLEDWKKNQTEFKPRKLNFLISSSPRHNVYGNDFGWGKPIAVRSGKGQKLDGKMTIFPASAHGGIDVEVCLEPHTMKALEDDIEFMEAVTP